MVGHSLGGGVAMQFAYQFPSCWTGWCWSRRRGGQDVNPALRFASLPGHASLALCGFRVRPALRRWAGSPALAIGWTDLGQDCRDAAHSRCLPEPPHRRFVRTLRAVVDWRGQVVTMLDRCYLTESVRCN